MLKFLFSFFLSVLAFAVSAQRPIDVIHYKYHISLRDESDSIKGKADIQVKFNQSSKTISFDLAGIEKGRGMKVSATLKDSVSLSAEHSSNKLRLTLPSEAKAGDTLMITIQYAGIPSDGLIISKNKYGHRSFFADNWPNRGHNWLPSVDDPGDKATVEFIVNAPQHYQVVANGVQMEETDLSDGNKRTHWKEDVPIATKVMVIGVAPFAVNLAGMIDACIPVYSWVYPEDRDAGFYDYAQALEVLPFFIKNVGPYGYKKLANVQSKTTFGGLENANTIFYHENSVSGNRKSETLITHEIAHQWFGNMATEKSFAHLWLSEGFATYMTILYMESKYGRDTAISMLREDRNQIIAYAKQQKNPVVYETTEYMKLLNPNSYQKGGWVLHMLRQQLGDSLFWKSIRSYYAQYAGSNADTRDLQAVFEKVSGKKLNTFFDQWLYTAGHPVLDIQWKYLQNENRVSITVKQTQGTTFRFPLELGFKNANGKMVYKTFLIEKDVQQLSFPVPQKIVDVVADPNVGLLFEGKISEAK